MGFFPDMAKPAKGRFKEYVVRVNHLGEAVIESRNEDGSVGEFVVARNAQDMIYQLAKSSLPYFCLRIYHQDQLPRYASGYEADTWAGMVEVLNGKSGPRRSRARAYWETAGEWVSEYVSYEWAGPTGARRVFFVTEKGKEYDLKMAAAAKKGE